MKIAIQGLVGLREKDGEKKLARNAGEIGLEGNLRDSGDGDTHIRDPERLKNQTAVTIPIGVKCFQDSEE